MEYSDEELQAAIIPAIGKKKPTTDALSRDRIETVLRLHRQGCDLAEIDRASPLGRETIRAIITEYGE